MRSLNVLSARRIIALVIEAGELQSINYVAGGGVPPYSVTGTRFDLTNGDLFTPGLVVDGTTGDVDVRGDITADTFTAIGPGTKSLVAGVQTIPLGGDVFGLRLVDTAWSDPDYAATVGLGAATPNQSIAALFARGNTPGTEATVMAQGIVGSAYASITAEDQNLYSYSEYDAQSSGPGVRSIIRAGDTLGGSARLTLEHLGGAGNGSIELAASAIDFTGPVTNMVGSFGIAAASAHANVSNVSVRSVKLGGIRIYYITFTTNAVIAGFTTLATITNAGDRPAGAVGLGTMRAVSGAGGVLTCQLPVTGAITLTGATAAGASAWQGYAIAPQ